MEVDLELVGERASLKELGALGSSFECLRRGAKQLEIDIDLFHYARSPDLHDDFASARKQRRMDLRDRRRRERLLVDPRERVRGQVLV